MPFHLLLLLLLLLAAAAPSAAAYVDSPALPSPLATVQVRYRIPNMLRLPRAPLALLILQYSTFLTIFQDGLFASIQRVSAMALTSEMFSDAWRAAVSVSSPPSICCGLHKLAGKEGDVVDVCATITSAEQQDFRSRCACIFLIDNR